MGKKNLTFRDIEIGKRKFYRNKIPIFKKDVDIEKVLVSKKTSFSKKSISTLLVTDNKVKNYI